jgi:rare lipoprotein A
VASATSARARVRFAGDARNATATKTIGRVAGFRSAAASWYGPGLYGNPLGCGGRLTTGTVGVAHKTLPCGTKLTLRYRGHTVRASVVDRGPFVAGREFDLTSATAQKLHFAALGTIQVSER